MSKYRITGYREGYAETQAVLDITVSKTWIMPDSTPIEKLTEHYRMLDADPRLRLYCFLDDRMIGFASSRLIDTEAGKRRVKMDFPVVLPGHENAVHLLFEKSIDVFRQIGAEVIESTFGLWGGSSEWANNWGFTKVNEVGVLYGLDIDSFNSFDDSRGITEFDPEIDLENVVSYFSTQFGLPEDGVRAFTLRLYSDENTLGYYVVRGKDGLLASGVLGVNPNIPSLGVLSAVHNEGIEYLRILMGAIVKSAKMNNIERIFMFFTHLSPGHPLMDDFASLGFRYLGSNINYEKRL